MRTVDHLRALTTRRRRYIFEGPAAQRTIYSFFSVGRYSFPRSQRVKLAVWRLANSSADLLRSPIRRQEVLLITGASSSEKISQVEDRLRFLLSHFENKLKIRQTPAASPLEYVRSTAVAAADASALSNFARQRLQWVADLDYEANPIDGWDLMDLGSAISRRDPQRRPVSVVHRSFVQHVTELKAAGPRPVYLFGTGPSLQLAGDRSFADGITVVCNTIVRDAELWHHLAPAFLTAGDAIYHFGDNAHARAFRADALSRLLESKGRTLFAYPSKFDVVVRSEFKEVQSSLVPIPLGEHTDVSADLTLQFSFPLIENVLNGMLLPLGCTLSHDVRLWGFDGRAPTDSGFWANSDRHHYSELMQTIRDSHPAFFAQKVPKGNENKYVNHVHGDLLEERLVEAECRGFTFEMLHPSWTPTLQKRYRAAS